MNWLNWKTTAAAAAMAAEKSNRKVFFFFVIYTRFRHRLALQKNVNRKVFVVFTPTALVDIYEAAAARQQ